MFKGVLILALGLSLAACADKSAQLATGKDSSFQVASIGNVAIPARPRAGMYVGGVDWIREKSAPACEKEGTRTHWDGKWAQVTPQGHILFHYADDRAIFDLPIASNGKFAGKAQLVSMTPMAEDFYGDLTGDVIHAWANNQYCLYEYWLRWQYE